jgi:alkylated DNA repair dioxygenase AlkB
MGFSNNFLPKEGIVFYYESFLSQTESDIYYTALLNEIDWRQQPIVLFGKKILQPRLTAWFSDEGVEYSYSGTKMISHRWIPMLVQLKQRFETFSKYSFNSALLNLYRDGNDSMGWHRDNEKELGDNPIIASITFGASRKMCFRHLTDKSCKVSINLKHGSLLIMSGETQHSWYHSIPKTKKILHPRINITFRNVFKI